MSTLNRRRTALLASTVVAAVLAVPFATPAAAVAAAAADISVFVADTDNDGYFGLFERTTPAGPTTTLVPDSGTSHVTDLATSADGTRMTYVQTTFSGNGAPLRDKVVVRDINDTTGRTARAVQDLSATGSTFTVAPSLSPDGSTVVWTNVTFAAGALKVALLKAPFGAGAATAIPSSKTVGGALFVDGATLLASDLSGTAYTLPLTGGTPVPTSGTIPTNANQLTVSPDGSHLAWSLDKSTGNLEVSDIQVAPLSLSGGVATIGTPVTVATGLANDTPALSADGLSVYYTHYDGDFGPGDVYSAPADGSSTSGTVAASTPADDTEVALGATDAAAPGVAGAATAFTLAGTSATIRWTLPTDPDLSGVLVSRNGGTARYVPAPLTSFVDTGLALGSTYTYALTAIDRSGNTAAGVTRQLTATAATLSTTDPTSTGSTKAPFVVRFGPNSPSSVHWTVTYRPTTTSTFTPWVSSVANAYRTFGVAGGTGIAATTAKPGTTYQFRAFATDAFGNRTGVATSGPVVVPWDQTKATLSGGHNLTSSSDYLGSVRVLSAVGQYARIAVTGNRFQVIGRRCTSCGVFDVYDGSTRVATIDSRGSGTQYRAVLYTRTYPSVQNHTLTIKPRATAGRPNVILDGFAVRR